MGNDLTSLGQKVSHGSTDATSRVVSDTEHPSAGVHCILKRSCTQDRKDSELLHTIDRAHKCKPDRVWPIIHAPALRAFYANEGPGVQTEPDDALRKIKQNK